MHSFIGRSSMSFNKWMHSCNYYHNQGWTHFHWPKKFPHSFFRANLPASWVPGNHWCAFYHYFTYSGILYEWSHMVCTLPCVVTFAHPCCCIYLSFVHFLLTVIFYYTDIAQLLSPIYSHVDEHLGRFQVVIMIKLHLCASLCAYVFQNGCTMLQSHRQVYEHSSCSTSSPTLGLARGRIIIASQRWPCPNPPNLWICHLPWQKGLCSYD